MEHYVIKPAGEAGEAAVHAGLRAYNRTFVSDTADLSLVVEDEARDERTIGQLIYFFEYACGLSGYLLGVNPFDQPGVEAYKQNMFALLGKPGFEARRAELELRP